MKNRYIVTVMNGRKLVKRVKLKEYEAAATMADMLEYAYASKGYYVDLKDRDPEGKKTQG